MKTLIKEFVFLFVAGIIFLLPTLIGVPLLEYFKPVSLDWALLMSISQLVWPVLLILHFLRVRKNG